MKKNYLTLNGQKNTITIYNEYKLKIKQKRTLIFNI